MRLRAVAIVDLVRLDALELSVPHQLGDGFEVVETRAVDSTTT